MRKTVGCRLHMTGVLCKFMQIHFCSAMRHRKTPMLTLDFIALYSKDCCLLEGKGENYQVCSVQYCVQQLCTVRCTHI